MYMCVCVCVFVCVHTLQVYILISFLSIFVLAWELAGAGGRSGAAIGMDGQVTVYNYTPPGPTETQPG